ncbi:MAG TPA: methyltransferase, partial [Methanotrichaceae archaeon]|nr:methyltransferase [Methanotrichaceae archaeon]
MKCPSCGKSCIRDAADLIAELDRLYMACPDCAPEPNVDKRAPFNSLRGDMRPCPSCKKAPLDLVMMDIMRVLMETGLRDGRSPLRSAGTPLVETGYPLAYPPRLGPRELIIASENLTTPAAKAIMERVPQVKGVILSRGVPGVVRARDGPVSWELLAGCDMRRDIISSIFGELAIYKSQSKVHIEFPRQGITKVGILERLFLQRGLDEVVDGMCGPGTLGLTCALAGARRVVLNDIWLPAVENVLLNLEANRTLLGIEKIEHLEEPRSDVGSEPVLVARASGPCKIEVYHGDLTRLFTRAQPASL